MVTDRQQSVHNGVGQSAQDRVGQRDKEAHGYKLFAIVGQGGQDSAKC